MSDIFEGFDTGFKGKRYVSCAGSMSLWVALHSSRFDFLHERRKPSRKEWKKIVLSYPYDTGKCICKECRYRRWYGK